MSVATPPPETCPDAPVATVDLHTADHASQLVQTSRTLATSLASVLRQQEELRAQNDLLRQELDKARSSGVQQSSPPVVMCSGGFRSGQLCMDTASEDGTLVHGQQQQQPLTDFSQLLLHIALIAGAIMLWWTMVGSGSFHRLMPSATAPSFFAL